MMSPFPQTCNTLEFTTSSLYLNQSITACSDKSFNFTDTTPTTSHGFNKWLKYQTASQQSPPQLQRMHIGELQRAHTAMQSQWLNVYPPICTYMKQCHSEPVIPFKGITDCDVPNKPLKDIHTFKAQPRSHMKHLPFQAHTNTAWLPQLPVSKADLICQPFGDR